MAEAVPHSRGNGRMGYIPVCFTAELTKADRHEQREGCLSRVVGADWSFTWAQGARAKAKTCLLISLLPSPPLILI